MKKYLLVIAFIIAAFYDVNSQALRLPGNTNIVCLTGRKVGVTQIEIHYSAPGVKGREGKIYGTNIVPFGYEVTVQLWLRPGGQAPMNAPPYHFQQM